MYQTMERHNRQDDSAGALTRNLYIVPTQCLHYCNLRAANRPKGHDLYHSFGDAWPRALSTTSATTRDERRCR
jgi:hypothetical protein